jgi:hypothetical protein
MFADLIQLKNTSSPFINMAMQTVGRKRRHIAFGVAFMKDAITLTSKHINSMGGKVLPFVIVGKILPSSRMILK